MRAFINPYYKMILNVLYSVIICQTVVQQTIFVKSFTKKGT